ncbi:MAG: hypothetical protein F6K37_26965 [Moorea sp. SIO4E2]|nr:hypothetical protein [Moorena sp. SIO4E2]
MGLGIGNSNGLSNLKFLNTVYKKLIAFLLVMRTQAFFPYSLLPTP